MELRIFVVEIEFKMSKKNKLQRFSEILSFANVYENVDAQNPSLIGLDGEKVDLKGKWNELHFKNDHPIILELACGRGEYSLGLAKMFPKKNFIGVDIKGARIWRGAKNAMDDKLDNVAFLRTRIEQIALFFELGEVEEIWITFPDPFLKTRKANRRLTSNKYLSHYRKILKPGSILHLKTDDPTLYEYSLETLQESEQCKIIYQDDDIYSKPLFSEELEIKTYYEYMHLRDAKKIKYIQFTIH